MLIRRSTYALYCLHDDATGDARERQQIYAFSVLTGRPEPLFSTSFDACTACPRIAGSVEKSFAALSLTVTHPAGSTSHTPVWSWRRTPATLGSTSS